MKTLLKPNDLTPYTLAQLTNKLNQGYECEVKYINDRVCVDKLRRKLLFKLPTQDGVKNYVIDSIMNAIADNPNAKVEFKRENDKVVIVLVEKVKVI